MSNRTLCNWSKSKKVGMFFRKKKSQKLNRIQNNPLARIVTFLTIYHKVILLMIDVVPITPWDFSRRCAQERRLRNSTAYFSRPAGKLSNLPKRISMRRYTSQMKTLIKSRPGKKRKEESGQAWLTSNCLPYKFPPGRYPPFTRKGSSQKIGSLEFLGYSEPRFFLAWLNLYEHGW